MDDAIIAVPLRVTIHTSFSESLLNKKSPEFRQYKTQFQTALNAVFKDIEGFEHIDVHNFLNGSVICNYSAVFHGVNLTNGVKNIHNESFNITIDNKSYEMEIDTNAISMALKNVQENTTAACEYAQNDCGKDYQKACHLGNIVCVPPCDQATAVNCGEHGSCVYDHRTQSTSCSCKESDTHVIAGKYCEIIVEKLQLESKYIVAIAASVGGVIVIAAAVAIVCLVYKMRRKAAKDEDESGEDIALDNIRRSSRNRSENSYEKFRGRGTSKETTSNGSIDDIERSRSEVTRVLDGVEHKVTRDEKGNEMYIYQPKQPRDSGRQRQSSVYSSASEDKAQTGSSMYNYIDTETKYHIRRPNVSIRTIRI